MKSHIFALFDLIFFIASIEFQVESWYLGKHKEAALWVWISSWKNRHSQHEIHSWPQYIKPRRWPFKRKTRTLSKYKQVVNYFLRTFVAKENIANIGNEKSSFSQIPNKASSQYAEELIAKKLHCERREDVYEDQVLSGVFIFRQHKSIRQRITGNCTAKPNC